MTLNPPLSHRAMKVSVCLAKLQDNVHITEYRTDVQGKQMVRKGNNIFSTFVKVVKNANNVVDVVFNVTG